MDFQDGLTPGQIRQLHRHTAVEAAGTQQRRVKGLRPVGGRQDHHTLAAIEAVHLRQQLVQGLLPLVIAAHAVAIALLADGVDLVNEHDARCLFIGLLEQIPHLGRAHAHEHLHKFRAGNGEERHIGLACHSLGQHGLARAGRANQQRALGHGRADLLILLRRVQIVHDLHQGFLGFLFARHVLELDAGGGRHIYLRAGLAKLHHGHSAGTVFHHVLGHHATNEREQRNGQYPADQKADDGVGFPRFHLTKGAAGSIQPVYQTVVVEGRGAENLRFRLRTHDVMDIVLLHLHQMHFLGVQVLEEGAVVHLGDPAIQHRRHHQQVEQQQHGQHDQVERQNRFLGRFDHFHRLHSPFHVTPPW